MSVADNKIVLMVVKGTSRGELAVNDPVTQVHSFIFKFEFKFVSSRLPHSTVVTYLSFFSNPLALRPCIHSERLKVIIIPTGSTQSFL